MIQSIVFRAIALALGGGLWWYQTHMVIENTGGWEKTPLPHVIGTIILTATLAATLPMAEYCGRKGHILKFIGMIALFAALIGGTLPDVIARTSETREAKKNASTVSHNTIMDLARERDKAQKRVDDMEGERKRECRSGFSTRCENAIKAVEERQATVDRYNRDIAAIVPKAAPGDTKTLAAVLGVGQEAYETYQPLFRPFAIEIGIWCMLWVAFAPSKRPRRKPEQQPAIPVQDFANDPVVNAIRAAGRPLSNDELAAALRVTKGAASKAVSSRPHLVRRSRVGRGVEISLVQ